MDINIGLGRKIYSDGEIKISEELIWPMISAINNFIMECTQDKEGLETAILQDVMVYLYSPLGYDNPLRFVFFTDIYDNVYYLEKKGQAIYELLKDHFDIEYFNPPAEIMEKAIEIVKYTQKFPRECISDQLLNELETRISELEHDKKAIFSQLFIGDIDGGISYSFKNRPELSEKLSSELFADILKTFKMDEDLWSSSSLSSEEKARIKHYISDPEGYREGWYIKQLGKNSDFWLVGYFYYKDTTEKEIRETLDLMNSKLTEAIKEHLPPAPF